MITCHRLSCWSSTIFLVCLLTIVQQGTSQSNNIINTTDDMLIRSFCNRVIAMSPLFYTNLNSTFASLRRLISTNGTYFATAENLLNSVSVYGTVQCRRYLSMAECVSCFDVGVASTVSCNPGDGGYVVLDDCFLRYQNYGDYYKNPTNIEDVGLTAVGKCGNQSASNPTSFNKIVGDVLSDIRLATPRTSNFYVATTRNITDGNATLYAVAQCIQNTAQSFCENCLNKAYRNLYGCLPNTEGRAIDLGCFMRYSMTPFLRDNQTTDMTPYLYEEISSKTGIIVAVTAGGSLFLLIVIISIWCRRRHQRSKALREDASDDLHGALNYSYKDIQRATGNFGEDYQIGRGGFGEIYKAIIDEKNVVAVKKLHVRNDRARKELYNEVKLMSSVCHRNLVRILGWSSEGPELLLVLEYMPNGSLDKYLWGEKKGSLSWKKRVDMIFGIARGLAHLHHEFHFKIIHRDIKSANILLDDDLQPKIADFGLARFQPEEETHVSTKFAGTMGYTAPEYATRGHLSDKVDTYSFGVVTLEIISGRRCNDVNSQNSGMHYLLEDAWMLYENNMPLKLVDETLVLEQHEEEHVKKIIEIGMMCTQSPVGLRPTMSEVVLMLSNERSLVRRMVGSKSTFIPG